MLYLSEVKKTVNMRIAIPCCPPLKSLLLFPYFILIVAGLTVPSDGGHGLLSIKSLSFIATAVGVLLYILLNKKFSIIQFKVVCFIIASMGFLTLWGITSIGYGEISDGNAFDQFKLFFLTVSVVAITIYLVSENIISFATFLKTVLYANFAFSATKISLIILHLFGMIDLWSMVERFGIRVMGMQIVGNVFRFQASIDIATPFLLFFFLQAPLFGISWSKRFRFLYLAISLVAIFLSFSRFLLFVGVLSLILHAVTLRLSTIVRSLPLLVIGLVLGLSWLGLDDAYTVVERRLLSIDNSTSDRIRTDQINAMMEEHETFPFMGKGLGGYATDYIRDDKIRHSYEVQWVAFLMQFGLLGIAAILSALGMIGVTILSLPWTRAKIGLFLMYLCWLLSGFTNPFLISLTSGILYSLFFLAGRRLRTTTTDKDHAMLPM